MDIGKHPWKCQKSRFLSMLKNQMFLTKFNKGRVFSLKLNVLMVFSFVAVALLSVSSLAALNVALSDQGTDVKDASGTALEQGNLTVLIYDALTGGNLIYSETFTNGIGNGSWNVMLGETTDLPLEYGRVYYKDYQINGEDASFVNGSGASVGRQFFYAPLGDIGGEDIDSNANITVNNINATGLIYGDASQLTNVQADTIAANAVLIGNVTITESLVVPTINVTGVSYLGDVIVNSDNITVNRIIPKDGDNVSVEGNLEMGGNNVTSSGYGFFGWLGSLANRITSLFVQDINVNGTITGGTVNISASDGNVDTSGNITADYFVGDGSQLTNLPEGSLGTSINTTEIEDGHVRTADIADGNITAAKIDPDSIDGTELADTITLDAAMNVVGNDFAVNNTNLFVDVSAGRVGIGTSAPTTTLEVAGDAKIQDDLNMTSNNITTVDCIKFASGGQICDSP